MTLTKSNHESHEKFLLQNLSEMRGVFCDVNLKVQDKTIPSHKLILSAVSPFFRNMFTSVYSESKSSEVELSELKVKSIEHFLDYIYSGELKCSEPSILLDLYRDIDYLQTKPLKDLLYSLIVENLTVESCVETWELFAQLNTNREMVIDFISDRLGEITLSETFLSLPLEKLQPLLREIVDSFESKAADEYSDSLYELVMAWSSHDIESRRETLGELLPILSNRSFSRKLIAKLRLEPILRNNLKCLNWLLDIFYSTQDAFVDAPNIFSITGDGKVVVLNTGTQAITNMTSNINDLQYFYAVSSQNKIYVIGGYRNTNKEFSKLCYTYDTKTCQWDSFEFPYSVRSHSVCALNQSIYVFGGAISKNLELVDNVVRYDIKTQRMMDCAPMPDAARGFSICQNGNSIYLTYVNKNYRLCVSQYLPASDSWEQIGTDEGYAEELFRFGGVYSTAYFNEKIYLLQSTCEFLFYFCFKTKLWANIPEPYSIVTKIFAFLKKFKHKQDQ